MASICSAVGLGVKQETTAISTSRNTSSQIFEDEPVGLPEPAGVFPVPAVHDVFTGIGKDIRQ